MSSPVSSRRVVLALDEALKGSVPVGIVGGVVLPAVPDDVEPGLGKDADGVWVIVSTCHGAVVEVGGPEVSASGVTGEVGDRVTQLLIARPAEADDMELAGLSGGGRNSGETGQRFGRGKSRTAIADL